MVWPLSTWRSNKQQYYLSIKWLIQQRTETEDKRRGINHHLQKVDRVQTTAFSQRAWRLFQQRRGVWLTYLTFFKKLHVLQHKHISSNPIDYGYLITLNHTFMFRHWIQLRAMQEKVSTTVAPCFLLIFSCSYPPSAALTRCSLSVMLNYVPYTGRNALVEELFSSSCSEPNLSCCEAD